MNKKQIIVISEVVCTLPNVVTVSVNEFLSNVYKNSYVLVDRSFVSTPQINQIKKHCQDSGLNPFLDGSYLDISYIFIPDWQAETDADVYNNPILEAIQYLEESETYRKLFEIEDVTVKNNKVVKLIALAKDAAASFGERRNAVNFAYKMMFGKC